MRIKGIIYVLVLVIMLSSVFAIEVSQPVQVTSNSHYERGESLTFDGTNYWLFYGRSDSFTGNYGTGNPDINDYMVYYKTATSVSDLATANSVKLNAPNNVNGYMGETGSVFFNDEVWAFATIDDGTHANLYGWYNSGGAWNEVADIVTGLSTGSAHHDEIVFNNEVFVMVRRGDDFYTTHSATPKNGGWSSEVAVGSAGGLAHFFKEGSNLYLAVLKSPAPRENQIFKYNSGTDTWTLIASTSSDGWDPALFKVDSKYVFVQAPWDNVGGGRQYLVSWNSDVIDNSFFDGGSKMISTALYKGNSWNEMWPIGFTDDSGNSYLFFTSERNPDDFSNEITGNIWYLKMNFDVGQDHYCIIQNALDSANSGDTVNVYPDDYKEGLSIAKNGITLQGTDKDTVIVDGTGNNYAVGITGDNVHLNDITISNAEAYNVKVSHCSNFHLDNVLIKGQGQFASSSYGGFSGLDFNNVDTAEAHDFEVKDCSKNGIAITASSKIILNDFNVHDNGQSEGWAGLAVYTEGGAPELSGNSSFDLIGNNIFTNNPMGIYLEDESGFKIEPRAFEKSTFTGLQQIPMIVKGNGNVSEEKEFAETLGLNVLVLNPLISPMRVYTDNYLSVFSNPNLVPGSTIILGNGVFPGGAVINIPVTITHGSNAVVDCSGSGAGFTVKADGTTIDGIEIQNCDNGVLIQADNFNGIHNDVHSNVNGFNYQSGAGAGYLNNNSIHGNTNYGVLNLDTSVLDATKNWWGHYSGPYQSSTNPNGLGDKISDNVAYDPWLCEEGSWVTFNQKCDKDEDTFAAVNYGGNDCDDNDANVHPGATEVCNGVDDDCDALTADGSGEQAPLNSNQVGVCDGSYQECFGGSWADSYSGIANYEATETTCDGKDNDCDGTVDEGLQTTYYQDSDIDNYGNDAVSELACSAPTGYVSDNTDCDDNDANVHPDATEVCNGVDDNCDGNVDETFPDNDNDGSADCVDTDDDNDGVLDVNDNCKFTANSDQLNTDGDDQGDICDADDDNDGVLDVDDNCQLISNSDQLDTDSDSLGDVCDDDKDNDGIPNGEDPRQLIPNVAPNIAFTSPDEHSWHNNDFDVSFSDSDEDGDAFTCEYHVLAKRAAASPESQWEETKVWTQRSCNDAVTVTVGRYKECPYEGYDYCKVETRATDEWGKVSNVKERYFSIDVIGPKIREHTPKKNEIIGDPTPKVEAYWNDRGSGLDLSTGKIKVDGNDVTNGASKLPDKIYYYALSDLSEGEHTVEVSISDNLGIASIYSWQFTIDKSLPSITINKPVESVSDNRKIILDVSTDEPVKQMRLLREGRHPQILCRNCDSYVRTLYFNDGEHDIKVEGEDYAGNVDSAERAFSVDSTSPRVYKIWPKDNSYIHGSEFGIKYTEKNLESVKLHWIEGGDEHIEELNCNSGRNMECKIDLDLAQYDNPDIDYYFEVKDKVNTVKSKTYTVHVDNSDPEITVTKPEEGKIYGTRRILFDVNLDEKADLSYSVDGSRDITLCRNCDDYNRYRTFFDGVHTLRFKAVDKAGNIGYTTRTFTVDSRKPRIHSTEPTSRYISSGEFKVKYTEANLKRITLHYGNDEMVGNCESGIKKECTVEVNNPGEYDGQKIKYYFEVEDIFGNVVKSRARYVHVDMTDPVLSVWSPQEYYKFTRYALFNIELDDKVKELGYTDLDTGRKKILCRYCDKYNRRLRLEPREYNLNFYAKDFAGNTNSLTRGFTVSKILK